MSLSKKGMALVGAIALISTCASAAQAKPGKCHDISDTTIINAPKEAVWAAVTSADKFDADVTSADGQEAIVAQKFDKIPFYGSVATQLKIKVKENESLSYDLIKADKNLKQMSGSWQITPIDKTKTQLKLTSSVDPGLPIPRFLVNQFIKMKVHSRLMKTRQLAEHIHESKKKSEISQKEEAQEGR
jgi:hypothetical protein